MPNLNITRKSILRISFLILSFFFIGWAIWPERRVVREVPLETKSQDILQIDEMNLIEELNDYQVVINSPYSVEINEAENIIILLERTIAEENIVLGTEELLNQTLAVEVSIRISNVVLNPGSEIIEPFISQDSQIFIFNISSDKPGNRISGDVWVNLLIYDSEEKLIERFPLLILPMQMKVVHLFGTSPYILKLFSAGIFLFLFLFFHRFFPSNPDDIITGHESKPTE